MNELAALFTLVVLVEGLVQALKDTLPDLPVGWPVIAALLGIAGALVYGIDAFALAGLDAQVPIVGQVLTGVVVGRGTNFAHDLWDRVRGGGNKLPPGSWTIAGAVDRENPPNWGGSQGR